MPTAVVDGIVTRYEVVGSGPPLLMYAPGGFNAVVADRSGDQPAPSRISARRATMTNR
jgi:hypothetical protein